MTLPASGALKLSNIASEFGGAAPHSMSEYRGDGGTPATGPIKFSDFYGTSSYTPISVAAPNAFASDPSMPYSASASSTASVSGGDGTHTYSWTKVSGQTLLTSGATSATATFSTSLAGENTAVYRITVNDGISSASDDITVTLVNGTPL